MIPRTIDYLEFQFNDKKWFFVIEHATALIPWRKSFEGGIIDRNVTIFHLDEHTDFYIDDRNINKSKRILEMGNSELNDFVMNKLHDDEFIGLNPILYTTS